MTLLPWAQHRVLLAPGVRGKTAGVLAATADSVHAHMVVIGCRTLGAMKRAFVGSVLSIVMLFPLSSPLICCPT